MVFELVDNLVADFAAQAYSASEKTRPFGIDMSIESMNSQEFSIAIFYFLLGAIVIFVGIVLMFMFKGKSKNLKTGEKWLFVWIFFGVVVAIVIGAIQMVSGFLL